MITTVVGNYPKISPESKAPNLRTAISRFDTGRITQEELRRVEEEVTREVIEEQVRVGLDIVTDGHIRWDDGQTYFASKIKGFALKGLIRYFDSNTYYRQPVAEARLERNGPIEKEDYLFAAQHSHKPVKAVITGPYTLARLSQSGCYQNLRDLVMDLASLLNQEARSLAEAGAPIIQFDEPSILKHKTDLPLFQEAARVLTEGVETKTAVYTYFGDISGLYPDFLRLPFDVIGLDFVMGKANFDLLADFPEDKELGFGILDARNTRMEPVEEVVEAIGRISRVVPLERLHVNPSCGLEFLPRANAYAKLERLVEAANKVREVQA